MECYEILLSIPPTSGRGVRYKLLSPTERDEVLLRAATISDGGNDKNRLALSSTKEGVKSMLVAVTKESSLKDLKNGCSWEKLNLEKLGLPGTFEYDKLFTAKDDEILCGIYQRNHGASATEVDMIAGKAQMVSMD